MSAGSRIRRCIEMIITVHPAHTHESQSTPSTLTAAGTRPTQQLARVMILAPPGGICAGMITAPLATTATPLSEPISHPPGPNPHTTRPGPGTTALLILTPAMGMIATMTATSTTHAIRAVTRTVTAHLGGTEAALGGEGVGAGGGTTVEDRQTTPLTTAETEAETETTVMTIGTATATTTSTTIGPATAAIAGGGTVARGARKAVGAAGHPTAPQDDGAPAAATNVETARAGSASGTLMFRGGMALSRASTSSGGRCGRARPSASVNASKIASPNIHARTRARCRPRTSTRTHTRASARGGMSRHSRRARRLRPSRCRMGDPSRPKTTSLARGSRRRTARTSPLPRNRRMQ